MAQATTSLTPEETDQALLDVEGILSAQLMKAAEQDAAASALTLSQIDNARVGRDVAQSLDSSYASLIGPSEQVIGRATGAGKTLGTWGGTRVVKDPKTGDNFYVAPRPEYQQAVQAAPHNDADVVQRMNDKANNPTRTFNIAEALTELNGKRGEEAVAMGEQLLSTLQIEIAKERDIIREQARVKSGLDKAETALALNQEMDRRQGGVFLTQASHETMNAQRLVTTVLDSATKYEAALVAGSTRIAELDAAKYVVSRVEIKKGQTDQANLVREEADARRRDAMSARDQVNFDRRVAWAKEKIEIDKLDDADKDAQKQINALERIGVTAANATARQSRAFEDKARIAAEKSAALRRTVSQEQLTNFRISFGTSGNDDQDRLLVINRRLDKVDKTVARIIDADTTSVLEMLVGEDEVMRQRALKLVNGHDAILNSRGRRIDMNKLDQEPDGEVTKLVKETLKKLNTPKLLLDDLRKRGAIDEKAASSLSTQLQTEDDKTKLRIKHDILRQSLVSSIQGLTEKRITEDVRFWMTSETASGPLKEAMDKSRTTDGDGKVPMATWIANLVNGEYKAEDGHVLSREEKNALANRAIAIAVGNSSKSFLFPGNTALIEKLQAEVKSKIDWGWVKKLLGTDVESRIPPTPGEVQSGNKMRPFDPAAKPKYL